MSFDILFNKQILPAYAWALDIAASTRVVPELDDTVSLWFWRFSICLEAERHADSEEVKMNISALEKALRADRRAVVLRIAAEVDSNLAEKIYDSWLDALGLMFTHSEEKTICRWIGVSNRTEEGRGRILPSGESRIRRGQL